MRSTATSLYCSTCSFVGKAPNSTIRGVGVLEILERITWQLSPRQKNYFIWFSVFAKRVEADSTGLNTRQESHSCADYFLASVDAPLVLSHDLVLPSLSAFQLVVWGESSAQRIRASKTLIPSALLTG